MTPQLMQAIKLLQLSNLDLAAYVEAELEQNPLLERIDDPERARAKRRPQAQNRRRQNKARQEPLKSDRPRPRTPTRSSAETSWMRALTMAPPRRGPKRRLRRAWKAPAIRNGRASAPAAGMMTTIT